LTHFGAQNAFFGPSGSKACGSNGFLMLFGPFGAKSVKIAQKAKNDPKMHFWSKNVTLGQKYWKLCFFAF
jgi:hypothetical protein